MSCITVNIKRLDPTVELPKYAHPTDAGLDLRSNEDCVLKPFERRLVSTGLAIALPDGYAGFVQPRSGLAIKQGLSIVNTPGLIDAHYRGELKVILINLDPSNNIQINKGDRIAQLVIQEVPTVNLIEVEDETKPTEATEASAPAASFRGARHPPPGLTYIIPCSNILASLRSRRNCAWNDIGKPRAGGYSLETIFTFLSKPMRQRGCPFVASAYCIYIFLFYLCRF